MEDRYVLNSSYLLLQDFHFFRGVLPRMWWLPEKEGELKAFRRGAFSCHCNAARSVRYDTLLQTTHDLENDYSTTPTAMNTRCGLLSGPFSKIVSSTSVRGKLSRAARRASSSSPQAYITYSSIL